MPVVDITVTRYWSSHGLFPPRKIVIVLPMRFVLVHPFLTPRLGLGLWVLLLLGCFAMLLPFLSSLVSVVYITFSLAFVRLMFPIQMCPWDWYVRGGG